MTEKLFLKWNEFQQNVNSAFGSLRDDADFTDVTLACEDGKEIEAHKVVLAASSPFFKGLFKRSKHAHPLIFMRGMLFENLAAMVDFLYFGEARVRQENLESFLAIAGELKLKGLMNLDDEETVNREDTSEQYGQHREDVPSEKEITQGYDQRMDHGTAATEKHPGPNLGPLVKEEMPNSKVDNLLSNLPKFGRPRSSLQGRHGQGQRREHEEQTQPSLTGEALVNKLWTEMSSVKARGQDKRDRDRILSTMKKEVNKAATHIGVAAFGMACTVSATREVEKVTVVFPSVPNTPIEIFCKENKSFLEQLEAALESTQIMLGFLRTARENGDKEEFAKLLKINIDVEQHDDDDEEEDEADIIPPLPVLQMNLDEITTYFTNLIRTLLQREAGQGNKPGRMWAGKGKPAGKIGLYDATAEAILPRDSYQGRGSGGEGITNKLRLVTCYLLHKLNKDHNNFFVSMKPNFKPTHIDFNKLESQLPQKQDEHYVTHRFSSESLTIQVEK